MADHRRGFRKPQSRGEQVVRVAAFEQSMRAFNQEQSIKTVTALQTGITTYHNQQIEPLIRRIEFLEQPFWIRWILLLREVLERYGLVKPRQAGEEESPARAPSTAVDPVGSGEPPASPVAAPESTNEPLADAELTMEPDDPDDGAPATPPEVGDSGMRVVDRRSSTADPE